MGRRTEGQEGRASAAGGAGAERADCCQTVLATREAQPNALGASPGGGRCAVWPVLAITKWRVHCCPFPGEDQGCELAGLAPVTRLSAAELEYPQGLTVGKRPEAPGGGAGCTWLSQLPPRV